jgi:DNA repair protein RecO (recombination protein O)
MARTYSAQAIVLKRTNLGEADRLITLLSKYKGKLTAIAKGIRKVASRKAPNLELLNHVKVYLAQGKTFDVITEAEAIETYKNLKADLSRVGFGFYLAEVTNEFLADGQGGREGFDLLRDALRLVNQESDPAKVKLYVRAFEIKFLVSLGFKPELNRCTKCGRELTPHGNYFIPEFGGVVHGSCKTNNLLAQPISRDALVSLRFLQKENWQKIQRLVVSQGLNNELERSLKFYLEYLLEKEIKSSGFINKVAAFIEKQNGKLYT